MVKKQALDGVGAEAIENASNATEGLEGIKVFGIQQTRQLIRMEKERTRVERRFLRQARIKMLWL